MIFNHFLDFYKSCLLAVRTINIVLIYYDNNRQICAITCYGSIRFCAFHCRYTFRVKKKKSSRMYLRDIALIRMLKFI